jgi:glycosyltransferase involved in cell wall biosynthesis
MDIKMLNDITVLIPTRDDNVNLEKCLKCSLPFGDRIVVDSEDDEQTRELCKQFDATWVRFDWNGEFPKKRNWALRNVEISTPWVLFLDTDEFVSEKFIDELRQTDFSNFSGMWLHYNNYFLGKLMRFGVPFRKLALFRVGSGEYERIDEQSWSDFDMEIHEHPIIDGNLGSISSGIEHNDFRGMEHWVSKHNQYSEWEARRYVKLLADGAHGQLTFRQRVKYRLLNSVFMGPVYFFYGYFFRLGFLDGLPGLYYHLAKMTYFWQIRIKIYELNNKPDKP